MTSIHDTPRLISTIRSTPRVVDFVMGLREAIQGWRKRRDVRANLHGLSDRELIDMGIARGEIDYVAAHPFIDPRGAARST
jgi:uncharacterized protein YjiS (DUF1127 family)